MSNVQATKDGLIEKSSGRKIISPLDFNSDKLLLKIANHKKSIDKFLSNTAKYSQKTKQSIKKYDTISRKAKSLCH